MAKKRRPAAKRPPAHEVILARLKELAEVPRILDAFSTRATQWREEQQTICGELLGILDRMHLPEQELPKILVALRKLRTNVIGTHQPRVQLLKRLSGHSPAHVTGAKPKRRRA